jgi:putative isomerase
MARINIIIIIALATLSVGCIEKKEDVSRLKYPNQINYSFTPASPKGKAVPMSDLGAWHGLAIPEKNDTIIGVTGPYLLGEFCWAGKYLTNFSIEIDGKKLHFDNYNANSYPGLLIVEGVANGLHIKSNTFYVSSRSHLNIVTITNRSDKPLSFNPKWQGNIFAPFKFLKEKNGVTVKTHNGLLAVSFQNDNLLEISVNGDSVYTATGKEPLQLQPNQTIELASVVTYMPYNEPLSNEINVIAAALANPTQHFSHNENRWNGYLASIIRDDIPNYDYVPVKALQTLITNWKSLTGSLTHQGIVPSMAVSYFYGFWAWDSWKHSVAAVQFEPQLAKDQIRAMFSYQDSMGMVADCVFPDPSENNWRDTKPPLAAWAVDEIFKATGDIEFVKELLPKLEKYHQWWYKYRDYNRNGLCEFGSTDGTLEAAKWESGMDNAVRYDDSRMIKSFSNAYSLNHESVDLNSYLYLEKVILSRLYSKVGDIEMANKHKESASKLKELINKTFFDEKEGFYFDINTDTGKHIAIAGPEGWTPLWCGVAGQEQADRVISIMLDLKRFNTFVPFPTLDASHPKFTYNGYWRGPIWLDQVYFGISALRKYGYSKQANELTLKVFDNLGGLKGDLPIYENYDPHTGEPLKAPNFSWSAAHLLMMYEEMVDGLPDGSQVDG